MGGDVVDVTPKPWPFISDNIVVTSHSPGVTARVSEVTRMLYSLDDGGRHLADTVGHGHSACWTHLGYIIDSVTTVTFSSPPPSPCTWRR